MNGVFVVAIGLFIEQKQQQYLKRFSVALKNNRSAKIKKGKNMLQSFFRFLFLFLLICFFFLNLSRLLVASDCVVVE